MVKKQIRNYQLKSYSNKEMEEIEQCMLKEDIDSEMFQKYFHVFKIPNVGIFYFIKERHFESRDGETNYAIALLNYVCPKLEVLPLK